jgi:dihydroorotate dehydrogenase electron transfer subunit
MSAGPGCQPADSRCETNAHSIPPSPQYLQGRVPVIENILIARDTYRLRIRFEKLASAIRPGQFIMLRIPNKLDPLLGRAFALYDVVEENSRPTAIDIVYLVVGKMTRLMGRLASGDLVEVWGPLGNGFPDYTGVDHLVMIAGGIGQTPFLALAKRALGLQGYGGQPARPEVKRVSFCYGVRNQAFFAGLEDFSRAGCTLNLATDDGSHGFHGFVTQLAERVTSPAASDQRWAGCGPEPMLHALAELAHTRGVPCDLSLETPMACGVGICFSCVTKVRCGDAWDYRRVCVEGPVFEAKSLLL